MKFRDQFCSLKLAMKLKELGFKQDKKGYFYFKNINDENDICIMSIFDSNECWEQSGYHYVEICSAFNVAQLGEILSKYVAWAQYAYNNRYLIQVDGHSETISAINEADARAETLICLIEYNIIDIKNTHNETTLD